jgi:hypothetical protein
VKRRAVHRRWTLAAVGRSWSLAGQGDVADRWSRARRSRPDGAGERSRGAGHSRMLIRPRLTTIRPPPVATRQQPIAIRPPAIATSRPAATAKCIAARLVALRTCGTSTSTTGHA